MTAPSAFWPVIRRLLAYARPWRKSLSCAVAIMWCAAAAEVTGPMLISRFIDGMLAKHQMLLDNVVGLVAAYLILQSLAAVLHYCQSLLFSRSAAGMVQRLRSEAMDAALRQPLNIFDTQPVGRVISRITNDTEAVHDFYAHAVSILLRCTALAGTMLVAMFILNWRMALVVSTIFPVVAIIMFFYHRNSTPIMRRVRDHLAHINNDFNEIIGGMSVIQQFRQQRRFGERIRKVSDAHYQAKLQALRLDGILLRPLINLVSTIVLCGLMLLFGFSPIENIEVGVLYAFIDYLGRLSEPLIELTAQQRLLQQALVAGERIFELTDAPRQQYGVDLRPLSSGNISIKNLSFRYRADERNILSDINLQVSSRQFIALVGHTGSGKSTLANLLMGYYPLTQGEIRLDGRPLSSLSHQSLRQGVAMVQQEPTVLAESLFTNVTLGRNIDEQQVWQVLHQVQLASFAATLRQGIHENLGEQGNNMSAGQKQLLALARVLVAPPKILILDEATANIDSGTEQTIQRTLLAIRKHTTLVVVAHRLSTITAASNILVLHRGRVAEHGSHSELLAMRGRYWQMYQLQLVEGN